MNFFEQLTPLIIQAGYLGIFAVVFAESGLLVGFFFPGDSLLLSAGLLASQGYFDIRFLLLLISTGAILGDSVGYWFGKKTGPKIFKREDSLFFHKDNILRAKAFYEKHGGKTIVLARFFPMIRTFAPIVAGVGEMEYRRFLTYNIFGGLGWSFLLTLSGYFLGNVIPGIDRYFLLVLAVVIFVSVLPTLLHLWSNHREKIVGAVKRKFRSLV